MRTSPLPDSAQPSSSFTVLRRRLLVAALACSLLPGGAAWAGAYDDALNAATLGDGNALARLLQRGIDPDTVDANGNTLLILAAREGQLAAVEALLRYRVRIDYRTPAGDSALMLAVLRGHDAVVAALLKAGAKVNHDGWAPLHYAAFEGRDNLLDPLVGAGADVNLPAPNQSTALMLAARNGHAEFVRRLLALPQTNLNALNEAGLSADAWARQNGNTAIADMIVAERKRRGLQPPALRITID